MVSAGGVWSGRAEEGTEGREGEKLIFFFVGKDSCLVLGALPLPNDQDKTSLVASAHSSEGKWVWAAPKGAGSWSVASMEAFPGRSRSPVPRARCAVTWKLLPAGVKAV